MKAEMRFDTLIEAVKELYEIIKNAFEEIERLVGAVKPETEGYFRFEDEDSEETPYLMPPSPEVFPPTRRWRKNRAFVRPKVREQRYCQRKRGLNHELL